MITFRCEGFGLRYPAQKARALHEITLAIHPGEVTWLTGALGSGTSTLLLALAGLAPRLTGGEREGLVTADGVDTASLAPLPAGIAYLGADPLLQLSGVAGTVRQEIAIGPMNLGREPHHIAASVELALVRLGIERLAERAPGRLSGGETQRVLLAGLLASAPSAWLLDEPFSALDRAGRRDVGEMLAELARQGSTVVVACDDADAMVDVADRLLVLRDGRVTLDGDPQVLLAGDAVVEAGAGTTDAAQLARDAGFAAPFPLDTAALAARLPAGDAPAATPPVAPVHRAAPTVLRVDEVGFGYGDGPTVLDAVSLEVGAGEAVGLFGSNGAGKSTLLRLAMALEQPQRGRVTTLDRSTAGSHPEDFAPRAGFLFQRPERQLFASSVRAECGLGARLAGWESARTRSAVEATLARLGLADVAESHPYDLPVPRRRLVALAALLVTDPDLLLLDEPTAALDANSRARVVAVVRDVVARGGAVLAITHDAEFAHEALDRGVRLEHGRVAWEGAVRDVLDNEHLTRSAALTVAMRLGLGPGRDRRADVAAALRGLGPERN